MALPDTVVNLLNDYFDIMVREIIAHDGYVDKFIGDAVMAVFKEEAHLKRAISSCLAIRNKINELPEISGTVKFKPKVSIGINSGEMISGNIGSAELRRLDYTVIGDTVNKAQRLQSAAKDGQVVIKESSYQLIKKSFKCEKLGEVELKNKANSVIIYEVLE